MVEGFFGGGGGSLGLFYCEPESTGFNLPL